MVPGNNSARTALRYDIQHHCTKGTEQRGNHVGYTSIRSTTHHHVAILEFYTADRQGRVKGATCNASHQPRETGQRFQGRYDRQCLSFL